MNNELSSEAPADFRKDTVPTASDCGSSTVFRPRDADASTPDRATAIQEKALEILRHGLPVIGEGRPSSLAGEGGSSTARVGSRPGCPENPQTRRSTPPETIPARMLNEFVYCPRLFYYEFVEGVFIESADTLRGDALHKRVDSGTGALPAASSQKAEDRGQKSENKGQKAELPSTLHPQPSTEEIIHSRSVQMGSERLGVVAKMDLVESKADKEDLFSALEVCPVDYKAGAPMEGADANELWDTDKMQLGLQALILRDNGYTCNEGVIYYRATKQRVRLAITTELAAWIEERMAAARQTAAGAIPAPLVNSPKCVRCSLAPVCLPDETGMLAMVAQASSLLVQGTPPTRLQPEQTSGGKMPPEPAGEDARATPRRLMAARDGTRPLYLNTQGFRVGCKDEVLQVKDKDKVVEEVRLRDLSHVALFGNIQISTQAIQALCEQEIPVTYFSMGGWFYGITRGHALKNVFLRMEQFRLARDKTLCLALARRFVHGKIRNHRTMIMRNHLEPPETTIGKLKRASEDALTAKSIEELLGVEGAAASQYFQEFSGMVKVEDDLAEKSEIRNSQPARL